MGFAKRHWSVDHARDDRLEEFWVTGRMDRQRGRRVYAGQAATLHQHLSCTSGDRITAVDRAHAGSGKVGDHMAHERVMGAPKHDHIDSFTDLIPNVRFEQTPNRQAVNVA